MADNYILTKGKDGETVKLALHENTGVGTGTFDLGVHLDSAVIVSSGVIIQMPVTGVENRLGDKDGPATSGGVSGAINQRVRHISNKADTFTEQLSHLILDGTVSGVYNLKDLAAEITSSAGGTSSGIISAITGAEAAIVSSVGANANSIVDGIAGPSGATKTLNELHADLEEASGIYGPIVSAVEANANTVVSGVSAIDVLKLQYPLPAGSTDVASAGTAVPLGSGACVGVFVVAKETNTGTVYLGTEGSGSQIFPMAAEDAIVFPCTNLNQLYLDAANSGEGVGYIPLGVS